VGKLGTFIHAKKRALVIVGGLLVLVCVIVPKTDGDIPGDGYVRVKKFVPHGVCLTIRAECGECYGQVIHDKCYVKPQELDSYQKNAMGL
jgi:hypothetical protein